MKRTLALVALMAVLFTPAPGSDGDKKDKKTEGQPGRIALTPAQSKTLEEIDQQFQRLQEEAQKQAQLLSARESGLITAFVMGTKLEGKQYKLVREKGAYVVEEVVLSSPESPVSSPTTNDAQGANSNTAQPSARSATVPASSPAPSKKER